MCSSDLEIRPVSRGQERIKEAAKLGFTRIIVPKKNKVAELLGVEIVPVENLREAVKAVFGSQVSQAESFDS